MKSCTKDTVERLSQRRKRQMLDWRLFRLWNLPTKRKERRLGKVWQLYKPKLHVNRLRVIRIHKVLILKTIGNRKGDCAWSCSRWQTQPEKICKLQRTNQCHSLRTMYWFVLCNLQIFSPRMPHTLGETFAHAQSLDFKNRNSWAGPGAASVLFDQHVRSGPETRSQQPALLQTAAETTAGG